MNTYKTTKKLSIPLISLKVSLMCTSILVVSACLPLTIVGGGVGIVDGLLKDSKIKALEKKVQAIEDKLKKDAPQPYVPSYVDMELFNKGLYDK